MADRICSVIEDDMRCSNPAKARGWCTTHWVRWRKYGDPLFVAQVQDHTRGPVCTLEGCDAQHYGHGFCRIHYRRWKRYGDPLHLVLDTSGNSTAVSYEAVHMRLRAAFGPASGQACVDCGRAAAQWSYAGGSPDERIDRVRGLRYTVDLDFYQARCIWCHRRYDH